MEKLMFSTCTIATAGKRLLWLSIAGLLSACATVTLPPEAPQAEPSTPALGAIELHTLRSVVEMQDRLYRVAAPLLINNLELCRNNSRNLLGLTAKTRYSYSANFVPAAEQVLGLDDRLQTMGVLPGSGAARAGVRRGDILLAAEDHPLPQGENAEREAAVILGPLVAGRDSIKLNVLRNGTSLALQVPLTPACAFGIELGHSDNVNAYADGYRILVTRGMLGAVRSDEELAYVMAKEMAHNVLAHAARLNMSATIGGIIDNLTRMYPDMSTMAGMAGIRPFPPDMDARADKLALYMLTRAGYGIDNAVPFWRRMAGLYPVSMPNSYTALHPVTAYRLEAMQ
jgi:hypothetical protein